MSKANYEKFFLPEAVAQEMLKKDLMKVLFDSAGLEENIPNIAFKVQARTSDSRSYVTVTMYTTGTLSVTGHGQLFDLTHSICNLYHKGIRKNNFVTPAPKGAHRKTDTRKGSQPKTQKRQNQ